ncbi:hypothetical protein T492DRAFT_846908 [Pavlovales sp. CCMP2436]|nr:hypothetical protein T492DRAFT_846908 [Pavlovales sp. CCMP2436]
MAHAIAADLRDFNASVLNAEPASAQLIGAPSAVSLFAAERRPSVLDVVKRQSSSPADIARYLIMDNAVLLILVAAVRETSAEQATQELVFDVLIVKVQATHKLDLIVSILTPTSKYNNNNHKKNDNNVGGAGYARARSHSHAARAVEALDLLADCEAHKALIALCDYVLV